MFMKRLVNILLTVVMGLAILPTQVFAAPVFKTGDYVYLGMYEQDANIHNGKEKLLWRVISLEGSKVLIVTDKIIDSVKLPILSGSFNRYSWGNSTLRQWCINFFQDKTNFNDNERSMVIKATLPESDQGLTSTSDFIFFLSRDEVTNYMKLNGDTTTTEYTPANMGISNYVGTNADVKKGNNVFGKQNTYFLRS